MSETNKNQNMDSAMLEDVIIKLNDGKVLNCKLNGTEYESEFAIADDTLSVENLSNVTINGVEQGAMKLINKYAFESGTRFALQQFSSEEIELAALKAQIAYIAMMANIDLV